MFLNEFHRFKGGHLVVVLNFHKVILFIDFRTWSGPAWSPAQSLSSVLISIQSLMNENPYHNEPGFESVSFEANVASFTFCNCKER